MHNISNHLHLTLSNTTFSQFPSFYVLLLQKVIELDNFRIQGFQQKKFIPKFILAQKEDDPLPTTTTSLSSLFLPLHPPPFLLL
jgi:hypothetical protein